MTLQPIEISGTRPDIIILKGVWAAKEASWVKDAINKASRLTRRLAVQAKPGMVDLTSCRPFYQYMVRLTRGSKVDQRHCCFDPGRTGEEQEEKGDQTMNASGASSSGQTPRTKHLIPHQKTALCYLKLSIPFMPCQGWCEPAWNMVKIP